jgi:hypothetical protein
MVLVTVLVKVLELVLVMVSVLGSVMVWVTVLAQGLVRAKVRELELALDSELGTVLVMVLVMAREPVLGMALEVWFLHRSRRNALRQRLFPRELHTYTRFYSQNSFLLA